MTTISTKTDYGLLLLTTIAGHGSDHPVSLTEVAKTRRLPMRYLAQIAVQLKNAGLLASKEGVGGGYMLARPASEIHVSDVFEAIEGGVFPVQCMRKDHDAKCAVPDVCTNYAFWGELRQRMVDLLRKTTIASLVREPSAGRVAS